MKFLPYLILVALSLSVGFYIRGEFRNWYISSYNDGCSDAALRLKIDTNNKYLYKFCEARKKMQDTFL